MTSRPSLRAELVVRAALLGLATGGRSSSGPAGLAWTSEPGDAAPLGALAGSRGRAAASAFALGEVVADKLPQTPSRLSIGPLAGRAVLGAVCGIGLAARGVGVPVRRLPVQVAVPVALVGTAAAVAGSYAGSAWRARAPFPSDVPAALVEDAVVASLCLLGCTRRPVGLPD